MEEQTDDRASADVTGLPAPAAEDSELRARLADLVSRLERAEDERHTLRGEVSALGAEVRAMRPTAEEPPAVAVAPPSPEDSPPAKEATSIAEPESAPAASATPSMPAAAVSRAGRALAPSRGRGGFNRYRAPADPTLRPEDVLASPLPGEDLLDTGFNSELLDEPLVVNEELVEPAPQLPTTPLESASSPDELLEAALDAAADPDGWHHQPAAPSVEQHDVGLFDGERLPGLQQPGTAVVDRAEEREEPDAIALRAEQYEELETAPVLAESLAVHEEPEPEPEPTPIVPTKTPLPLPPVESPATRPAAPAAPVLPLGGHFPRRPPAEPELIPEAVMADLLSVPQHEADDDEAWGGAEQGYEASDLEEGEAYPEEDVEEPEAESDSAARTRRHRHKQAMATAPHASTLTLVDHLLSLEFSVYEEIPHVTQWHDEELEVSMSPEAIEAWEEELGEPAPVMHASDSDDQDAAPAAPPVPFAPLAQPARWAGGVPWGAATMEGDLRATTSEIEEPEPEQQLPPPPVAAAPHAVPAWVEEPEPDVGHIEQVEQLDHGGEADGPQLKAQHEDEAVDRADLEPSHETAEHDDEDAWHVDSGAGALVDEGPPAWDAAPGAVTSPTAPAPPVVSAPAPLARPEPQPVASAQQSSTGLESWRELARDRHDPYDVAAALAQVAEEELDAPTATAGQARQAVDDEDSEVPPWEPRPSGNDEFFVRRSGGRRGRG